MGCRESKMNSDEIRRTHEEINTMTDSEVFQAERLNFLSALQQQLVDNSSSGTNGAASNVGDDLMAGIVNQVALAAEEGTSLSAAVEDSIANLEGRVASLLSEEHIHDTPENYESLYNRFLADAIRGGPSKVFEASGLTCVITRTNFLFNVGYIILPQSHPLHGKSYDHLTAAKIPVHREWTYAKSYDDSHLPSLSFVSFTTEPNAIDWVVGFDCGHASDFRPQFKSCTNILTGELKIYRDVLFVEDKLREAAAVFRFIATVNIGNSNDDDDDDDDVIDDETTSTTRTTGSD